MKINIHNQTTKAIRDIEKVLTTVFKKIESEKNIEIIIVKNKTIKSLNKTYRNFDKVTDVLSFVNDDNEGDSLGDIFISYEQAEKQAREYRHSFEREIGFLAVHGYLHLIGYDHESREKEKKMIDEQKRILNNAGLKRDYNEKY